MSSESVRQMRRATVLCLALLSLTAGGVLAARPDSANRKDGNKTRYWVARREKSDPDEAGNLAVAIQISHDDVANITTARIWQYPKTKVKSSKEYYDDTNIPVIACNCDIKVIGTDDNIKRETIELKDADGIVGWITRWHGGKGAGVQKSRRHVRLIFRYSKAFLERDDGARARQKGSKKAELTDDCEEPPADDVLEEESLDPPADPPTDPPEISYDP